MSAPIVYKSTDANAPVVNGVAGSFVNALEKCLVTGYGDKTAAGWTKPYSNAGNTIACFRPNPAGGTGFYLQVDHVTINAYTVRLRAYESMTSEVDGTLKWADTSEASYEVFCTASAAGTTARPWVIIATDTWVFCTVYGGLTSMPTTAAELIGASNQGSLLFGDFDTISPSDAYNCLFAFGFSYSSSGAGTTAFGSHFGQSIALNNYHKVARAITGIAGGEQAGLMGGVQIDTNFGFGSNGFPSVYEADVGLVFSRVTVRTASRRYRGFLRGILAPMTRHPLANLATFTENGVQYMYVMFCNGYRGGIGFPAGLLFRLSE